MTLEEEDFEAWKVNPITVAVMARARKLSEACKETWIALSWSADVDKMQGIPTERLAYLRGKAEIATSFAKLDYKDIFKEQQNNGKGKKSA